MDRLPAIQFYPGDWLRDEVSGCSLSAQGLWLRMMFIMHDADRYGYLAKNGAPIPAELVAQRCGAPLPLYTTLLDELDRACVPSRLPDGTIFSRRMVRDAKKRYDAIRYGRKGGNPKITNHGKSGLRVGLTPPLTRPEDEDEDEDEDPGKRKRGAGKKRKPETDHARLIEFFCLKWMEKNGNAYTFNGGKDGVAAKSILKSCGSLEGAVEVISRYLSDDDPFTAKQGWNLGFLWSRLNTYRAKAVSKAPSDLWVSSELTDEVNKALLDPAESSK